MEPRDVAGDGIVTRAAEQTRHRLSPRLAADVPDGDVDRGDRIEQETAGMTADAHRRIQAAPQTLRCERVFADGERPEQHLDDRARDLRTDRRLRFAPPDDAVGRLDADEHRLEVVRIHGGIGRGAPIARRGRGDRA